MSGEGCGDRHMATVTLSLPEDRTRSLSELHLRTASWGQTLVGPQKTSGTAGFAPEYVPLGCFAFFGLHFKALR